MTDNKKFMKIVKPDTGYNDCDMSSVAQKFYREYFPDLINCERGETWFTPIALLEPLGRRATDFERICSDFDNREEKLNLFKLRLMSTISKKIADRDISKDFHTLVNFGCHPSKLNIWRGFGNRSRLGDFPDLYFECIRNWFLKVTPIENGEGYSKIEDEKLSQFDWWFIKFCDSKERDEEGWKKFVDDMRLKGSFVNNDYTVKKLFTHKIGNPFPNLSAEFENKRETYTFEELSKKLSENEVIRECINNIYTTWDKRAIAFQHKQ